MNKDKGGNTVYKKALGYSLPQLTQQIIIMSAATYLMYFLTDLVGLSVASVTLMLFLSKIWDSLNDPVIGWFIDEKVPYRKKGKFKPLFLYGTILMLIGTGLQFTWYPTSNKTLLVCYYIVMFLTSIFATISGIAFPTLAGLMTPKPSERTLFTVFRSLAGMVGGICTTVLVIPAVKYIGKGNDRYGFTVVIWILMVLSIIVTIIANHCITEYKTNTNGNGEKKNAFETFYKVFKNRAVVTTFLMSFCVMIALNVRQALSMQFLKHIIGNEYLLGIFSATSMGVMALCLFFIPKLSKKLGKLKMIDIGISIHIITSIIMALFKNNVSILIAMSALSGVAIAFVNITSYILQLDSIEYQEWKYGNRQEGTVWAIYGLVVKFGGALAPAFAGLILSIFKYDPKAITPNALLGIQVGYFYVPIIFFSLALVAMLFNPMTEKKMEKVRKDLFERRGEVEALD